MAEVTPKPNRGRLYLLVIIGLFLTPLALAWLLVGNWRPVGSVHHGQLLDPVRPVDTLSATVATGDAAGQTLDPDYLRGRWTLAYLAPADCDQACRTSLYNVRQIRLALGKNIDRTQSLVLLPEPPDAEFAAWLGSEHAAMTAVQAPAAAALLAEPFAAAASGIYLLDPLTNLVLRYEPDTAPKGILEDLKRLLKYSKIG